MLYLSFGKYCLVLTCYIVIDHGKFVDQLSSSSFVVSVLCSFFDPLVTGKQVQNSVDGLSVLQL